MECTVVHKDVNVTMLLFDLGHEGLDALFIANVQLRVIYSRMR